MTYSDINYEIKDRIVFLTINRPKVFNALSSNTKSELEHAIHSIELDDNVGGVIITGAGKSFCSGNDISENYETGIEVTAMAKRMHTLFNKFQKLGKPIIAAVNGYALGGGCELALACDIRIASENAVFSFPEVSLGGIPSFGGTQRLPRLVGVGVSKEIMFTARKIKANEAKAIGIVNKVAPIDALINEAETMMRQILKNAPLSIKHCKYLIDEGIAMSFQNGHAYEAEIAGMLVETEDNKEGVKAFLEKREPVFKNK